MADLTLNDNCTDSMIIDPKLSLLLNTFNELFIDAENTEIRLSCDEPLYISAKNSNERNKILFSHGFFSSALHEISHWLVAGENRRKLDDYGYWYKPDGRNFEEQQAFEKVEILPQAIEWILSTCCAHKFHFSADNLDSGFTISDHFKVKVSLKAQALLETGFPDRMERLTQALLSAFATAKPLADDFVRVDVT